MRRIGTLIAIIVLAAACTSSGGAGASTAATNAPPTSATAPSPSASTGGGKYGGSGEEDPEYEYGPGVASAKPARSAATTGGALVIAQADGAPGAFLTGKDGLTLYIFKKDTPNKSACADDCATNWPPLTVAADGDATAAAGLTGALTTFARPDGSLQVAYDGAPLYYFAADKAAGDTKGQGVGDVWFVAAP